MPSVKKLAVHVSPYTVASQASEKGATDDAISGVAAKSEVM